MKIWWPLSVFFSVLQGSVSWYSLWVQGGIRKLFRYKAASTVESFFQSTLFQVLYKNMQYCSHMYMKLCVLLITTFTASYFLRLVVDPALTNQMENWNRNHLWYVWLQFESQIFPYVRFSHFRQIGTIWWRKVNDDSL